jgi:hypothetical protein
VVSALAVALTFCGRSAPIPDLPYNVVKKGGRSGPQTDCTAATLGRSSRSPQYRVFGAMGHWRVGPQSASRGRGLGARSPTTPSEPNDDPLTHAAQANGAYCLLLPLLTKAGTVGMGSTPAPSRRPVKTCHRRGDRKDQSDVLGVQDGQIEIELASPSPRCAGACTRSNSVEAPASADCGGQALAALGH